MRKNLFLWGKVALSLWGLMSAQSRFIRCYTMEVDSLMRAQYPDWPKMDDYEPILKRRIDQYKTEMAQARTIGQVYRIPVVVHVIHNGEALGSGRNIPDANIQHQIEVLNEDFRRMLGTPGWNNHPRGADVMVEFVLAKRDPSGNPTTGIVRWNCNAQGWTAPPHATGYINSTIKPATQWDPTRYLNIWVCDISGGVLGYAQFPDLSSLLGMPGDGGMGAPACAQAANTDGVVILYGAFGSALKGSTGLSAPYHLGRTTTHEVGHWLGLRHTWGDGGCTVDDYCDDTPVCNGQLYGCNAHPVSQCGNDRMIENYMDYSDDGCMNIFTIDQAVRMRIVLENCPRRRSLITSPALVPPYATDAAIIDLPIPQDLCPGTHNIAAVLRNNGTTNNLTSVPIAYQINGGPWQATTWTGTLAPGSTTNLTLSGLSFTTPGVYNLTVCSNLAGDPDRSEDTVRTTFTVHNGFYPLFEDFEAWSGRAFPASLWRVSNPDGDCVTWRPAHCVGSNGQRTTAMYANLWAYDQTGRRDELYTPLIDLTNAPAGVSLAFDVAYARYDNSSADELRVEISTDCGATWSATPLYQRAGNVLATTANTTLRYIPSAAGQWRTETVSLNAYTGQRIRLRFVTINQYGNNIWIDNVRITHQPFVFFRDTGAVYREELTWPALAGDCRRYTDVTIPVYISAAPSANVTVGVSLATGSTAYAPGDIQILTPTLTFPAGSSASQNLTVRLFDEEAIEADELAALQLSVTSGPATTDPQRRVYRVWIENNDFFPPEVVLFREDFEAGATGWTQVDIVGNSTNRWSRGTQASMGGSYAAYVSSNPTGSPPPHNYSTNATSRVALVSPPISTVGATNLVLAFDVRVAGEYTPAVFNDFGRLFYSTTSATGGFQPLIGCAWPNNTCLLASELPRSYQLYGFPSIRRVYVTLPAAAENQANLWLAWRWDNDADGNGTQPPMAIDNIVLYGRRLPQIENTLTSTSTYFGPYDSVYVYSPNGRLMVRLVNLDVNDYGCTTVQIDRAGASAQALRPGHTSSQYVTDKTFLILPTNNAINPYNITLYYTTAEVNGWQTATGNTWSSQGYVVKTDGSIASEYTAPAPTYALSGVTTGTITGGAWAFGNFSTFSGFAVGVPPPPLYRVPEEVTDESRPLPLLVESPWREALRVHVKEPLTELRLYNLSGELLWRTAEPLREGWHVFLSAPWPAGLYLLEALPADGGLPQRVKILHLP